MHILFGAAVEQKRKSYERKILARHGISPQVSTLTNLAVLLITRKIKSELDITGSMYNILCS